MVTGELPVAIIQGTSGVVHIFRAEAASLPRKVDQGTNI
jgi:hypothetical protein